MKLFERDEFRTFVYLGCYVILLLITCIVSAAKQVRNQQEEEQLQLREAQKAASKLKTVSRSHPIITGGISNSRLQVDVVINDNDNKNDNIQGIGVDTPTQHTNTTTIAATDEIQNAGLRPTDSNSKNITNTLQLHQESFDISYLENSTDGSQLQNNKTYNNNQKKKNDDININTRQTYITSTVSLSSIRSPQTPTTPSVHLASPSLTHPDDSPGPQVELDKIGADISEMGKERIGLCSILCSLKFYIVWLKDILRRRSIYGTVLVYAFDIITDVNVMILWFNQWLNSDSANSNGIGYLAICSLTVLMTYRIVSAVSVYKATSRDNSKLSRIGILILQFLDVYILIEVFRSHQKQKKTDKLVWINAMEASLESAPQILLQLVYILKFGFNDEFGSTNLVLFGLLFSVAKLGNTVIAADATVRLYIYVEGLARGQSYALQLCHFCVVFVWLVLSCFLSRYTLVCG